MTKRTFSHNFGGPVSFLQKAFSLASIHFLTLCWVQFNEYRAHHQGITPLTAGVNIISDHYGSKRRVS